MWHHCEPLQLDNHRQHTTQSYVLWDATQYNYMYKIELVLYNIIFYNINKYNCSSPLPPTRHHARYGLVDIICNTSFVPFYRRVSVFLSKICPSHTQLAIDGLHTCLFSGSLAMHLLYAIAANGASHYVSPTLFTVLRHDFRKVDLILREQDHLQ